MTPDDKETDPTWSSNAWLEIDRAAFEANIRAFQNLLGANIRICAVMKTDAYGHGISLLQPSRKYWIKASKWKSANRQ